MIAKGITIAINRKIVLKVKRFKPLERPWKNSPTFWWKINPILELTVFIGWDNTLLVNEKYPTTWVPKVRLRRKIGSSAVALLNNPFGIL